MNLGRHGLEDDVVDGFWQFRVPETGRRHQLAAHQAIHVRRRGRLVRQHAGQHLVHRYAQRVEIGREHRSATKLLGRHVRRTADHGGAVSGNLEKARRAEIGDFHQAALRHQHVRRPQIAVQHTVAMGMIDGVADLAGVVERNREIERALPRDQRFERFPGHELHDDEEDVLLLLGGQDRHDVGMPERREQTRLAQQLAEVDALAVRHFQRDVFVDPGIAGEVHGPEAAAADRGEDFVLADKLSAEKHPGASIPNSEFGIQNSEFAECSLSFRIQNSEFRISV